MRKQMLVLTMTTICFAAAAHASDGPDAYLAVWQTGNGNARVELRGRADGKFDAIIVWISPASDRAASIGDPLARGFTWDERKHAFVDGTAVGERNGKKTEASCSLAPMGDDRLEFRVSAGLLSRDSTWSRVVP